MPPRPRLLAEAAVNAGAPDGVIQVVQNPSIPLIDALMADEHTDVIVATGGPAVVRSAYSSGTRRSASGPGTSPFSSTLRRTSTGPRSASSTRSPSTTPCSARTSPSSSARRRWQTALLRELHRQPAPLLDDEERDRLAQPTCSRTASSTPRRRQGRGLDRGQAGVRVPPRTRVLLAPIELVVAKSRWRTRSSARCWRRPSPTADRGIETARAVSGSAAPGHSASIHSGPANHHGIRRSRPGAADRGQRRQQPRQLRCRDQPGDVDDARHRVLRRASVDDNVQPRHLVHWTWAAYNADA